MKMENDERLKCSRIETLLLAAGVPAGSANK